MSIRYPARADLDLQGQSLLNVDNVLTFYDLDADFNNRTEVITLRENDVFRYTDAADPTLNGIYLKLAPADQLIPLDASGDSSLLTLVTTLNIRDRLDFEGGNYHVTTSDAVNNGRAEFILALHDFVTITDGPNEGTYRKISGRSVTIANNAGGDATLAAFATNTTLSYRFAGASGAVSVWPIYADVADETVNNQSFDASGGEFIAFYRSGTQPTLPVRTGITFRDYVGNNGPQGPQGRFEIEIFQRSTTAPATPTGGTYNLDTATQTPPTGWFVDPPVGVDTLYEARADINPATQSGDVIPTWGIPFVAGSVGTTGPRGFSVDGFQVVLDSTFAGPGNRYTVTTTIDDAGGTILNGGTIIAPQGPAGTSAGDSGLTAVSADTGTPLNFGAGGQSNLSLFGCLLYTSPSPRDS